MELGDQLLDAWQINHRVNLKLLGSLSKDALATASRSRARSVADQFAHLHNVRLRWLAHGAPTFADGLVAIPKGEAGGKAALKKALTGSTKAMASFWRDRLASGKEDRFAKHLLGLFGYFMAHEGHHRGLVLLTLKLSGFKVDRDVQYGIWEWGKV